MGYGLWCYGVMVMVLWCYGRSSKRLEPEMALAGRPPGGHAERIWHTPPPILKFDQFEYRIRLQGRNRWIRWWPNHETNSIPGFVSQLRSKYMLDGTIFGIGAVRYLETGIVGDAILPDGFRCWLCIWNTGCSEHHRGQSCGLLGWRPKATALSTFSLLHASCRCLQDQHRALWIVKQQSMLE